MDTVKTKDQLIARDARIIAHARAGHTMTEIVDMEGLDASNTKRWHLLIREAGVVIEKHRESALPIGLVSATEPWRFQLGLRLRRLREVHPQIEVSRMVGMTNAEINAAIARPPTHDWTVSQLFRLSQSIGVPFEQMMKEAFSNPLAGIGFGSKS